MLPAVRHEGLFTAPRLLVQQRRPALTDIITIHPTVRALYVNLARISAGRMAASTSVSKPIIGARRA